MKTIFLLLLLCGPAQAAVKYWIDSVEFSHDASSGTFVSDGVTYGLITGGSYTVKSSDTVTGQKSDFHTTVAVSPYLTSFPSASTLTSAIQTDAINKGAKTYLDRTRAQCKVPGQIPTFTRADVGTPGVSTQTVTLP